MITYKNITLVKSSDGDWEGIYLDNEIYYQTHSISAVDIFDLINDHHLQQALSFEVDWEWISDSQGGLLPNLLSDIPEGARV